MTNKDWWFLLVCTAIVAIFCTWGICSTVYFERGVSNTRLYHQTTDEFPTKDWVSEHTFNNYKYPEQIEETLKEFTLSTYEPVIIPVDCQTLEEVGYYDKGK